MEAGLIQDLEVILPAVAQQVNLTVSAVKEILSGNEALLARIVKPPEEGADLEMTEAHKVAAVVVFVLASISILGLWWASHEANKLNEEKEEEEEEEFF